MDSTQFDDIVRSVMGSRRSLLGGSLAVIGSWLGFSGTEAKKKRKKHKHKKRKPKATPNEFGCLEVGDPCTSEADCCSGVCEEGKKGKRTCRAHDTGTCEQGVPGACQAGNPFDTFCNGGIGYCARTTAGSNVCVNTVECAECKRDSDCEALGYPPGSACAPYGGNPVCAGVCPETDMACVFLNEPTTPEE